VEGSSLNYLIEVRKTQNPASEQGKEV